MRLQCVFNASSMRLQCVFNASSMRLNPRPRLLSTVLLQSSPSPENIFKKTWIFKKVKNDPTQICPLGTHEQHFFGFLFEAFRRGKIGGVIFLR